MTEQQEYRRFTHKAEVVKTLNTLQGILNGIAIDCTINLDEIVELTHWCNLQREYIDKEPFNEIIPYVEGILDTGTMSHEVYGNILFQCQQYQNLTEDQDVTTHDMQEMHGIIHGILADNIIRAEEVRAFYFWLKNHGNLAGTYPYDEIYSLVCDVLEDWKVSEEESLRIKALFGNFIDTRYSMNVSQVEIERLQQKYAVSGVCARNPQITVKGKMFCATGGSTLATRKQLEDIVAEHGGKYSNNVTKKVDYLIVGNEGNPSWMYACYGRKIEKAVAMRKAGSHIMIVNELDFWGSIDQNEDVETCESEAVRVCEEIKSIIAAANKRYDIAAIEHRKYAANDTGAAITMFGRPCFSIKGKDIIFLYVAPAFESAFNMWSLQPMKSTPWKRVPLSEVDISLAAKALVEVYEQCWVAASEQFDCCSRYMACSDAKDCVHPDAQFSGGCRYRQKLRRGQIFYGENRNI